MYPVLDSISPKTMKKILLVILLVFLLPLAGFFFLKAKNLKILPSQADIGNNVDPRAMNSFKGVLGIEFERPVVQTNGEKETKSVPSPFSSAEQKNDILTFAVIGDTQSFNAGNPNGNFQKAVKNIVAAGPDVVITVGDLVGSGNNYSDYVRRFGEWKKVMSPLLSKTRAVMGNHDNVDQKGEKAWQEAFDFPANGPAGYLETVYSFDLKNSHFAVLNSDHEKEHLVNGDQRAWLEQNLAKNQKENVFVFFHEPAWPVSDKAGESLDADPAERNALWEILKKHKVTAVFNGHEHIVSRRKIEDVYQFVFGNTDSFNHGLPASGIAEYANQIQGSFGIVKVNGKEITVETYGPGAKLLDTFTFSK